MRAIGNVSVDCQRGQEARDLRGSQLDRVTLSVVEDAPSDPRDVAVFGSTTVVARAQRGENAIEKPRLRSLSSLGFTDGEQHIPLTV